MVKRRKVLGRQEVSGTIETKKKEMAAKENDLDKIATDVETIRQTLEKLDFGGTQEGAEQIERAIESAENVTEQEFEREDANLEKIQDENKEFEGELGNRRGISESDLGKVSDAGARINTKQTINELVKAKEAAMRDIDFLKEQIGATFGL